MLPPLLGRYSIATLQRRVVLARSGTLGRPDSGSSPRLIFQELGSHAARFFGDAGRFLFLALPTPVLFQPVEGFTDVVPPPASSAASRRTQLRQQIIMSDIFFHSVVVRFPASGQLVGFVRAGQRAWLCIENRGDSQAGI